MFGAVNMASTLGMALDPRALRRLALRRHGSYFWLIYRLGSFGIGPGAVAIALTFRPPCEVSLALPSPERHVERVAPAHPAAISVNTPP